MLGNLANDEIFKKTLTNISVFKAFVRNILGIEVMDLGISTEKPSPIGINLKKR